MSTGSLQRLAGHLAGAVAPLDRLFRDADAYRALMWRLGWETDALPGGSATLAAAARDAVDALAALADGASVFEVLAVVDKVGATYQAIGALSDAPDGIDVAAFRAEFPRQLFEHLLVEHLASELPGVLSALEAIGVVAFEDCPATAERPGFTRTRFDWSRLPDALADPDALPAQLYGWGGDAFDVALVVEMVTELADALGCPASLDEVADTFASAIQSQSTGTPAGAIRCAATLSLFDRQDTDPPGEVTLSIAELPAEGTTPPGLLLRPRIPPGTGAVDLGDGWSFAVRAGTDLSDEFAIVLRPGDLSVRYPFSAGKTLPVAGFGATLAIGDGVPVVVLGDPGGIRAECARVALSFDLDDTGDGLDLALSLEPAGLALVLSGGGLDSFLATILGDAEMRVDLGLGLRWSNRGGLALVGGAGLEVSIPIDRAIGTVRIERVDLGLRLGTGGASGDPPQVKLRATATASGSVGPIVFSVDGLGVELPIVFADGNAGPFDVRFDVVWPTALGLGVDAEGIVTGGGFLDLDLPAGRYAGVAALQMLGVGLTAMGIIETKLPAPPGWSLFLSVIADFTPVPLGFGFTLTGVGGFMGLHRSFDELALAEGVREGRLDSLLFPEDPLADAARILADIEAYFPSLPEHHVFGAMARFGWGTPTLVTAELGVIVAVPDLEIAVVGELATVLPREDLPLLELHMGVVGFIDVPAATTWVAASIYDSRLVGLTLSGDMAMYLSLGDTPYFLLSVGGFHPAWSAPPSVPSSMTALRRMAAALDLGTALDIGVEAYLAVTSNTLQFGAEVHAVAHAREFAIDFTADGWFGFDVLLTLTPLSLSADMSAGVAIRAQGETLAGIQLDLHLEGPQPWYATGRAEFTFLLWDVPFHVEVGGRPAAEAPDTIELWPVLEAAIADPASWLAPAPAEVLPEVSLRALDPVLEPGLWVRPDRGVELRQRVLPLSRELDAYGALAPTGPTRFDVEAIGLTPGVETDWTPVQDWFAAAQFTTMRVSDRLSAPSFELMDAGAGVSAALTVATRAADVAAVEVVYEEAVMRDRGRAPRRTRPLPAKRLGLGLSRPGRARSGPGGRRQTLAPTFSVTPTRYAVVDPLRARVAVGPGERGALASARVTGHAFADALGLRAALDRHHPPARGRLRIVPVHDALAGGTSA